MISPTAQNIIANASVGNCAAVAAPREDEGKATIESPIRLLAASSIPTLRPSYFPHPAH
jgi:hypothetical protein